MADTPNPAAPQPKPNQSGAAGNDAQKASEEAHAAEIKALEAQAKVDEAKKSAEQREADKAKAQADDARAQADEAEAEASGPKSESNVVDAKIVASVPGDMKATHHLAQKSGLDPANPKPARAEHEDPELATVELSRDTSDSSFPVTGKVHPEMVGDYLRAGWSKA